MAEKPIQVGGSEVAAICGLSKFCTPMQLFAHHLGLLPRGQGQVDDAADAGRFLEEGILRWYAKRTGRTVVRGWDVAHFHGGHPELVDERLWQACREIIDALDGYATVVHVREGQTHLRSVEHPWMVGGVDAFVFDEQLGWGIVDAKNLNMSKRREWIDEPQHYLLQLDHYLSICGPHFKWYSLAAVFGGQNLETRDYDRSEARLDFVRRVTSEWCDRVRRRGVPESDELKPGDAQALAALYPKPDGPVFRAWPGMVEVAGHKLTARMFDERWVRLTGEYQHAKAGLEELKLLVLRHMGGADETRIAAAEYRRGATNRISRKSLVGRFER